MTIILYCVLILKNDINLKGKKTSRFLCESFIVWECCPLQNSYFNDSLIDRSRALRFYSIMRRCNMTWFLYIFLSHYYLQSAIVSCGRLKITSKKKYIGGIINVKSNTQCQGAPQSLSSFTPRELPCQFYKSTVEPTYSEPWMLSYPKHINFGEIPCLQPHQS